MIKRTLLLVFGFLLVVSLAHGSDERSIKDLAKALTGLSSDVDPAEAQALSYTAHTTARRLKKEYRVVLNPEFTVFLYNVGMATSHRAAVTLPSGSTPAGIPSSIDFSRRASPFH